MANEDIRGALSEALRAAAVYPPSRRNNDPNRNVADFDVFSIVKLTPAKSPCRRLRPTGLLFTEVFDGDETNVSEYLVRSTPTTIDVSDQETWRNIFAVGVGVPAAGTASAEIHASAASDRARIFKLCDWCVSRLTQAAKTVVREHVCGSSKSFFKLTKSAGFSTAPGSRFAFGIVTEAHDAKIISEAQTSTSTNVGAGGSVAGPAGTNAGGNTLFGADRGQDIRLIGEGIIGVRLMCFVVDCTSDRILISEAIETTYGDEAVLNREVQVVRSDRRGRIWRIILGRERVVFSGRALRSDNSAQITINCAEITYSSAEIADNSAGSFDSAGAFDSAQLTYDSAGPIDSAQITDDSAESFDVLYDDDTDNSAESFDVLYDDDNISWALDIPRSEAPAEYRSW